MKAIMPCVLLVLLLPAAGEAQRRPEILASVRSVYEIPDTAKYQLVFTSEEPPGLTFLDTTTIRTVNGRPRAWFTTLRLDQEFTALSEADCIEQTLRWLAVFTYDGNEKLTESSDAPSGWQRFPPGSLGDEKIRRLCR